MIGIDLNEGLLSQSRSRHLANAAFRRGGLRAAEDLGVTADGLWCSFTAAYFPDLPAALVSWGKHLRPGGWVALMEIDDLFGHEPLGVQARSWFEAYAREALAASRYDFHMGRKLQDHLEQSGFAVSKVLTLDDQELSFSGPALPEVVDAWRARFDRMKLFRDFGPPLRCEGPLLHRDPKGHAGALSRTARDSAPWSAAYLPRFQIGKGTVWSEEVGLR